MAFQRYAANESDAALKALWAGVDMSMQSGLYREYIPTLIAEGRLSMDTLDTAVRRVLGVKAKMGLFDNPYVRLGMFILIYSGGIYSERDCPKIF